MARYSVLLEWDPGDQGEHGAWVVTVPVIPNLVTEGDSIDHALAMAQEAIQLHLYGVQQDGEELPIERCPPILASVEVDLARLGDGVISLRGASPELLQQLETGAM